MLHILKAYIITFPCRKLAVLFGNMSECYMQLDDIEQSYKAAETCVRYGPTGQIFDIPLFF
jgi:hypothetical protein